MSFIWKRGLVLVSRQRILQNMPVRVMCDWKYGDPVSQGIEMKPKKKKNTSSGTHTVGNIKEGTDEKLEPDEIEREIVESLKGIFKGIPGPFGALEFRKKFSDYYDLSLESGLKNLRLQYWKKKKKENLLDPYIIEALGMDLAVAQFVLAHKGAVKFYNKEDWYKPNKAGWHDVPRAFLPNWHLEAIDLSNSLVTTHGLSHFDDLPYLRYLNVSNCRYVDDYFCDRLTRFRDTLVVLDLSGCPKVTERGISSLHRLRKLRRLYLNDMPHVCEAPLLAIALEDQLPNLEIIGIDYNDLEQTVQTQRIMPRWLEQFEKVAVRHLRRYRRIRPQEEVELREVPLNPVGVPLIGAGSEEEFAQIMEAQKLLEEPPKLLENKPYFFRKKEQLTENIESRISETDTKIENLENYARETDTKIVNVESNVRETDRKSDDKESCASSADENSSERQKSKKRQMSS